jgi:hypothetical protein
VNIRDGGSNIGSGDNVVYITGGSVTIDDSDIGHGSNVGLKTFSASGTDATLVMHRTLVHDNGSHSIHIFTGDADIENSASWTNAGDGIKVWAVASLTRSPLQRSSAGPVSPLSHLLLHRS